ncbi:hypothetical protein [Maritalea sp.]|uniref:hypothetical protein n=1 Tax=Maritalea sp. TaxID=2003361 RepID=UPI003EF3C92E
MVEIYNAGTVAAAQGSKRLVLTGGGWTDNVVRVGDLVVVNGGVHISFVEAIINTTEIDLKTAFGPASASGLSYEILHSSSEWASNVTLAEKLSKYILLAENPVKFSNGSGTPAAGDGENGQQYVNNDNGDLYAKANDAWTIIGNIKGPKGDQGDPGPQGPAGDMSGANNLSELTDVAAARTKLALASSDSPEFAGVYLGGSGAANKLDDYEEGTWTPILTWAVQSAAPTYAFTNARYVKKGSIVHVMAYVTISNAGVGSNGLDCGGLPFANGHNFTLVPLWSADAAGPLGGYISGGESSIRIAKLVGASDNLTQADLGGELGVQFAYFAA